MITNHNSVAGVPTRLSRNIAKLGAGLVSAALILSACGLVGNDEIVASADSMGHVHDLVLDNDGKLLAATHSGLYRIDSSSKAVLVGAEQNDLMAMTKLSNGDLLAGGHPDLRIEKYRVEGQPPFLGLAATKDQGQTWEILDLLGQADFHALVPYDDGVFTADSSGQISYLGPDGQWSLLGQVEARDLAIDPQNSDTQIVPDYGGLVWTSTDGGASWARAEGAPPLVEIEWLADGRIVAFDSAGNLWSSESVNGPWAQTATGPVGVETFFASPAGPWWVALEGGSISRSDDQGTTWVDEYRPPEN